jgi:hypothetical protein
MESFSSNIKKDFQLINEKNEKFQIEKEKIEINLKNKISQINAEIREQSLQVYNKIKAKESELLKLTEAYANDLNLRLNNLFDEHQTNTEPKIDKYDFILTNKQLTDFEKDKVKFKFKKLNIKLDDYLNRLNDFNKFSFSFKPSHIESNLLIGDLIVRKKCLKINFLGYIHKIPSFKLGINQSRF